MLTRRFGLLPTSESHLSFGPEFNPFFVHIELYALSGAKQKEFVRHFASERDKPVAFHLSKLTQQIEADPGHNQQIICCCDFWLPALSTASDRRYRFA